MQNKYRVCVIGCGVIAPNHIKSLVENEKTELVAVCDILEDRARARAELGHCAYYTDYHQRSTKAIWKIFGSHLKPLRKCWRLPRLRFC